MCSYRTRRKIVCNIESSSATLLLSKELANDLRLSIAAIAGQ